MKPGFAAQTFAACALIAGGDGSFAQHRADGGHVHEQPTPARLADAPYAGQQLRPIKALSAAQTQDLLAGKGMELAKAAELNGYPGPMHTLELAAQLQLTAKQKTASEALMIRHKAQARTLGAQVIEAERRLDGAFATRQIDHALTARLTRDIANLQARLRAEHLQTHLAQTALLDAGQIAAYKKLRGYD